MQRRPSLCFFSRMQEKSSYINEVNQFFENRSITNFKYLMILQRTQFTFIHGEVKKILNPGNYFYHSFQNLFWLPVDYRKCKLELWPSQPIFLRDCDLLDYDTVKLEKLLPTFRKTFCLRLQDEDWGRTFTKTLVCLYKSSYTVQETLT